VKKSEVALLLTMTKSFDDRVSVDEARVEAWHAALHFSMDFDTAKQLVIDHYAERTNALMPAHLNEAWRTVRRRQIEQEQAKQRALESVGAPPSEEFLRLMRTQMNTLFTDTPIPEDILQELQANPCPTCHASSEQPCNETDKPHPARWDVAREKVKNP